MVCKQEIFILAALQIVSSGLEDFNNGQQLAVIGLLLSLYRNYLPEKNGYWMPSARIIRGQLTENSINSIARSIRLNSDMTL